MFISARKENSNYDHQNSTTVELGIRQGNNIHDSNASTIHNNLEHLVLQSGSMALQNMEQVFRRELNENDLHLFSGHRKVTAQREYRQYEKNIHTLLKPHWNGPVGRLKKHIRRSLKPFRKSTGLLIRLLSTPARITATACLMVLLSGHPADSSTPLNTPTNTQQLLSPPAVKQEGRYQEIIFADSSLANLDLLLSSAPPQAPVVMLKPTGNLIGQMLDHLLHNGPAESVHLFTHGAPGQLNFGGKVINQATLKRQAKQLNLLGTLLSGSRDIYLYGCQVGAGKQGFDFIHLLSSLTMADVAASDNFTGSTDKGGDWELELVAGNIDGHALTSLNYTSLLASGHVIAGDGSGGGGGGESGGYYYSQKYYPGGSGGAGGGDNDTITGTDGDDIIFGDGSGGGGGGGDSYLGYQGPEGSGGGGNDSINGGAGNDILFGDGFDGNEGSYTGGEGGFGGGGGGGGSYNGYLGYYYGAKGGIGAGGGGGSDYADGGEGGFGGGGGGAGGYDTYNYFASYGGLGGGFNAGDGLSPTEDEGGGGGGGGYAGGIGGTGGTFTGSTPGDGGNGGFGTNTSGGGRGGRGGADYGGGGGGGGFGGGIGGNGGRDSAGSPGTAGGINPVTLIDDAAQTIHTYVTDEITTLSTRPGGAGNDILDGGPGSDDLFGMGGTNTFVFESDDADSGNDIDTIYDWNTGSANRIALHTGGTRLTAPEITTIISAQIVDGVDRSITHSDSPNQVTIVVKGLGRDLVTTDFISTATVNAPPTFNGTPRITGIVKAGQILALANTGTHDPDGDTVTLSYQWHADGVDISTATSATYTVTPNEIKTTITCTITADDDNGGLTSFTTAGVNKFPWAMFLPAITAPKY